MRNREKKEKNCLNCGLDIPNRNVYCNNKCQLEYQLKNKFELLLKEEFETLGREDNIDVLTKKYLIMKHGEKCMRCDWSEINIWTNKIPIQLNHIF